MHRSLRTLVLGLAMLAVASSALAATVSGTVTVVDEGRITVDGRRYTIERDTVFEDMIGGRLDPAEIQAGTVVELEIEDGRLALVRADVVR